MGRTTATSLTIAATLLLALTASACAGTDSGSDAGDHTADSNEQSLDRPTAPTTTISPVELCAGVHEDTIRLITFDPDPEAALRDLAYLVGNNSDQWFVAAVGYGQYRMDSFMNGIGQADYNLHQWALRVCEADNDALAVPWPDDNLTD